MNRIFGVFLLSLFSFLSVATLDQARAAVGVPSFSTIRQTLNRGNPRGDVAQLGMQTVDHKIQLLKARYRFALNGGGSVFGGTGGMSLLTTLLDEDGQDAALPWRAVVKQVTLDVLGATGQYSGKMVASNATTHAGNTASLQNYDRPVFSIGVNTSNDLFPATSASTLTGSTAGTPVGTAATMVKVLGTSTFGNSTIKMALTGGSIISGDFNVFVEYYLSE